MSKLFLDCGSNLGQGYEFFSSIYGSDCTYHLFEPNIKCYNILVEKYKNEIVPAMMEKFGGDSLGEMRRNFDGYLAQVRKF